MFVFRGIKMSLINIRFPDGNEEEFDKGVTGYDVAKFISEGLANSACAIMVNDELRDLHEPINEDVKIKIITFKDKEGLDILRHSTAHVMAYAIKKLFPESKFAIGPSIEDGFYYDFDNLNISTEDFPKIEAEMKKIIKQKMKFKKEIISNEKALEIFKDEPYKTELIKDLGAAETISIYSLGDFVDLCRGPHIPHTGKIKAFKLMKLAGAYWRGDSDNVMLTRIYGTCFPSKKELKEYLEMLKEAEKRDHRKIGKEMDLFSFQEEGQGMPFWHNNGVILMNELLAFWRELHKGDYTEIKTPMMLSKELWKTSGHWENYRENMYVTNIDDEEYAIKPMNCPGGILAYKNKLHSYKEFPMRIAELGMVHRHELAGVLHGLFRVREFTQDDAHVYCLADQLEDELVKVINLVFDIYKPFNFKGVDIELSTRPENKFIGKVEDWDLAENALKNALDNLKINYKLNVGDGAFYGPKIDFHIKDSMNRSWQCATLQLDFNLPERFDMRYMGEDGTMNHRPIMLHRAIFGSIERFIGILIEHYAGKFPLWLSPVQAIVIPVNESVEEYTKTVNKELQLKDIRSIVDLSDDSLNKKIRNAQLKKINYILVVGNKEESNKTVNVRTRDNEVHGEKKLNVLIDELNAEISKRK
jgi:threonyl-tRNA synthetase